MSDSVQPHRRQPSRLPRAWDSPGKNTGVGFHFLLQCMKVKSESEVAQSCPTLSDFMDCSLSGSSVHGIFQADFKSKNSGGYITKHCSFLGSSHERQNIDTNIKAIKLLSLVHCMVSSLCFSLHKADLPHFCLDIPGQDHMQGPPSAHLIC